MHIKTLSSLARPGIYILTDRKNKKVYINYSINMLKDLTNKQEMFKTYTLLHVLYDGKSDLKKLSKEHAMAKLSILINKYEDKYKLLGYEVVRTTKRRTYKLKYGLTNTEHYALFITTIREEHYLGSFYSKAEMESFIQRHYSHPYIYPNAHIA